MKLIAHWPCRGVQPLPRKDPRPVRACWHSTWGRSLTTLTSGWENPQEGWFSTVTSTSTFASCENSMIGYYQSSPGFEEQPAQLTKGFSNFGTRPNNGKKRFSACDIVRRINIPKFIDTNILIASGNNDGLVEKLPGFD